MTEMLLKLLIYLPLLTVPVLLDDSKQNSNLSSIAFLPNTVLQESLVQVRNNVQLLELKLKELESQNVHLKNQLTEIKLLVDENTRNKLPRDCKEVQQRYGNISNIYRIQPDPKSNPFLVLCDMKTNEGGWAYIMNRFNGSQDFDLDWKSYKEGFGRLDGEFWLGLENVYKLIASNRVNELLIELVDWNMQSAYAHYNSFSIGDEQKSYFLEILTGFNGSAGDALSKHVGKKFTTKDRDQDNDDGGNCAAYRFGGWWYDNCFFTKLTGKYLKGKLTSTNKFKGIHWRNFHEDSYSLKQARMLVRPRIVSNSIKLPQEGST